MPDDRVVAVGLLTERDLRVLGEGFRSYASIDEDDMFADLIAKLNEIEATPERRRKPRNPH